MSEDTGVSPDMLEGFRYGRDLAAAKLANWMTANGFSHGAVETIEELLRALEFQIDELRERRYEETLRRSDGGVR